MGPFPDFPPSPISPLPLPPPFPSSLDSKSLPLTSPLPVLSPLHNDSSFPLWSPVAQPPIPQIIGGAFSAFICDVDDGGDDAGDLSASPTFSPTPIPRDVSLFSPFLSPSHPPPSPFGSG
jgi:hypothetical protein